MWPFKTRKNEKQRDYNQNLIDELREFRGMGETFNYLGRTLIVTAHTELIPGVCGIAILPCLQCDYANENGDIKRIRFSAKELPGLIKQQEKPNA